MWVYLGIISCLFLGLYDICKKHSLQLNAVMPVLLFSTICGFLTLLPLAFGSHANPELMQSWNTCVSLPDWQGALLLLVKAIIMTSSWILTYYALKHLPISIVTPIRASGPVWTLLGAILLFGEHPNAMQWAGLSVIFISYYIFSLIGRQEGIHFHRNKWVLFIFLATLIGTISTLYDKLLIQRLGYGPVQVQFWTQGWVVILLGLITLFAWYPNRKKDPFRWRSTIPLIGILLALADFAYFRAVNDQDALIAILSVLRRSSALVSFFFGAVLFKDLNKRKKAMALIGVLAGVILIVLAQ